MNTFLDIITSSNYFALLFTFGVYEVMRFLQKKSKCMLLNPLLFTTIIIILFLVCFRIPYEDYENGGKYIQLFMPFVTTALAVNIYQQRKILMKNFIPIVFGCALGSITSIGTVVVLCKVFQVEDMVKNSLLSKSVTAPFAIGISESLGGEPAITIAAVVVTGIIGMLGAPIFIKIFHIKNEFAAGLAIGMCSHAFGTSKACEIGEIQGAASSVAIGISGIATVIWIIVLRM